MTRMTLDSCIQKFKDTVGEVVKLEISGPNDDGDYVIMADNDCATLHEDGSFQTESPTLTTSLEKHFGQFRE